MIILLEVLLRVTGPYKTYAEKLGEPYSSYWGYSHDGHDILHAPNDTIEIDQPEFSTTVFINSLGLRNPEITSDKPDSVFRIICLGDSYTEGDGAPFGVSYPRQLEVLLNKADSSRGYEVINAGISGSDVIYSERLLQARLSNLNPDLVILALNDTDTEDIILRGGRERFKSSGATEYRDGPGFEAFYSRSHVFRFITHTFLGRNRLLIPRKVYADYAMEASSTIDSSVYRLHTSARKQGYELLVIYHPLPHQIHAASFHLHRGTYEKYMNSKRGRSWIMDDNVDSIYNLSDRLIEICRDMEYESYAWPLNGHFNTLGYGLVAGVIRWWLEEEDYLQSKGTVDL